MVYSIEHHTGRSRRLERDGETVLYLLFAPDGDEQWLSPEREREAAELCSRIVSLLNRWSGERKPN